MTDFADRAKIAADDGVEPTAYECEIAVVIVAYSPQEAANLAQEIIDENTDRWSFDVRDLDSGEITTDVVPS